MVRRRSSRLRPNHTAPAVVRCRRADGAVEQPLQSAADRTDDIPSPSRSQPESTVDGQITEFGGNGSGEAKPIKALTRDCDHLTCAGRSGSHLIAKDEGASALRINRDLARSWPTRGRHPKTESADKAGMIFGQPSEDRLDVRGVEQLREQDEIERGGLELATSGVAGLRTVSDADASAQRRWPGPSPYGGGLTVS